MERLLVTGVDQPLGSNLALTLADRMDVLGLYSQHAVRSSAVRTAFCPEEDRAGFQSLAQDWQPRWIIHCGPLSASSWDASDASSHVAEEPRAAVHCAAVAGALAARLTVISSDLVFAGPRMFHEETSPAANPSPRATQVRAMEQALASTGALVVRTHAFGWSPVASEAGFAERAFEALSSGGSLEADGRRHATPILATDLAELLWRAYERRLTGLVHLAGAERASRFRFVTALATALALAAPSFHADHGETSSAGWHEETSLNSKRARRMLEMATPLLREGLDRFAAQAHNGWRDRWEVTHGATSQREVAA